MPRPSAAQVRDQLEGSFALDHMRRSTVRELRRLRAEEVALKHTVDAGDVEHVLYNLTLQPFERLEKSMRRAGFKPSEEESRLLDELVTAEVPFMIVGLSAAVIQGADVVTQDIDLWFRSTSHPGLSTAAEKVGGVFVWRTTPQLFSGPGLDSIDVVFRCDGLLDFDTEVAAAIDHALPTGTVVKVLPIERVRDSKKAADRPKDRAVIPALEAAIAAIKESSGR
jgi:hypothetical protein